MHDLRVELHAVHAALRLLEGGDRRRRRTRDDTSAARRRCDGVAVRHPDRLLGRRPGEELGLLGVHRRLAEFRHAGTLDAAAELLRHQLHSVANAERRNAELEDARVDARRAVGEDRRRTAAQDHSVRIACADLLRR